MTDGDVGSALGIGGIDDRALDGGVFDRHAAHVGSVILADGDIGGALGVGLVDQGSFNVRCGKSQATGEQKHPRNNSDLLLHVASCVPLGLISGFRKYGTFPCGNGICKVPAQ